VKRYLLVPLVLGALAIPVAASASPAATSVQTVALAIKSDTEHGRMGPDGKWHDAYLPGRFTVRAGSRLRVTISNYDTAPHTFTAPGLHVNAIVRAGSASRPSTTTFTFTAPKPGSYRWRCLGSCDTWAMRRLGFMTGVVTVV
jgi:plastocyanin